jgi:hypothetical protein
MIIKDFKKYKLISRELKQTPVYSLMWEVRNRGSEGWPLTQ